MKWMRNVETRRFVLNELLETEKKYIDDLIEIVEVGVCVCVGWCVYGWVIFY